MNLNEKKSNHQLIIYFVLFYLLAIITVSSFQLSTALRAGQAQCSYVNDNGSIRIEDRIASTKSLVESLAKNSIILDDSVDIVEKAKFLKSYSDNLGYMMICYIDENMYVWNIKGEKTPLSSREYLQNLFKTSKTQITDVFAAGADGRTLNYTIAAPIIKNEEVSGAVFAAVYYTELDSYIAALTTQTKSSSALFGSEAQVMNYNNININYGDMYIDVIKKFSLIGTKAEEVEQNLLNCTPGRHWEFDGTELFCVNYTNIENTSWMFMTRVSMSTIYSKYAVDYILSILCATVLCALLFTMVALFYKNRMASVNYLIRSVQQLERQLYQNEQKEDTSLDVSQILNMTGKGLTDGLTGVVTRTVFMDRVSQKLAQKHEINELSILAFIDVDDLKRMNDTYGHEAGDEALKEIGYVLRKYEKTYDGMVGRYGGDEFVVYLTGFKDEDEILNILDEISTALRIKINVNDIMLQIHCSVGATICGLNLTAALKAADEGLYIVKRSGKNGYRLV